MECNINHDICHTCSILNWKSSLSHLSSTPPSSTPPSSSSSGATATISSIHMNMHLEPVLIPPTIIIIMKLYLTQSIKLTSFALQPAQLLVQPASHHLAELAELLGLAVW